MEGQGVARRALVVVGLVAIVVGGCRCTGSSPTVDKEPVETPAATVVEEQVEPESASEPVEAEEPLPVTDPRLDQLRALVDGSLEATELLDEERVIWIRITDSEKEAVPPPDALMEELGLEWLDHDHRLICGPERVDFAEQFEGLVRRKLANASSETLEDACDETTCSFPPMSSQDATLSLIFEGERVTEVHFHGFNLAHRSDPEGQDMAGIAEWVEVRRAELRARECE